jgi:hypothetical protein
MSHLHQVTDYVVEADTGSANEAPQWMMIAVAVLCCAGLFLLGTVAGHVWSMTACIDPGAFGLLS